MPKRKKRELQHLRQEPARRRNYQLGTTSTSDIYRPGFPMNLLGNPRLFAVLGILVIVSFVVAAILTRGNGNSANADDVATLTPTPTRDPSATVSPTSAARTFTAAESIVDPAKEYRATIKTSKGEIVVTLYADKAPQTVNSFVFLAKQGYFDGIAFHRVVKNFVVQGGDPSGTGSGGPGYSTKDEPNEIANKRGTLSMAKTSGATEFGSQFFINLKDNSALDYNNPSASKFYPFGEVSSGMDVVDAIGNAPVGAGDKPNPPITIISVVIDER